MTSIRDFAIDTLRHRNIDRINFRFGTQHIYPRGYRELIRAITSGRIRIMAVAFSGGNRGAEYSASTEPGRTHTLSVSSRYISMDREGTLRRLSSAEQGMLRMAIVHEMTHALQDYNRSRLSPQTSEASAYVAGWIAAILWRYEGTDTMEDHQRFARGIAQQVLSGIYEVDRLFTSQLEAIVPFNRAPRSYTFNGI